MDVQDAETVREKKPRRTQDARSRDTRERLLRATIDVLLERGFAGLTTALVEAKAGVSSGARVHHYRSKADLVLATTQFIYNLATELGQKRARSARTSREPIRAFIADCRAIYMDWPFLASIDVVIAARTDPDLMNGVFAILNEFHAGMKATWLDALVASGQDADSAELDLRLTLNMMRGMAVNNIWQSDVAEYERLIEVWCEQLRAGRIARDKRAAAQSANRKPSGVKKNSAKKPAAQKSAAPSGQRQKRK